jgi:lysozyme
VSAAIDLTWPRLQREEGIVLYPYDDATGKRVRAPVGHLSWLSGINLETEGTPELAELIDRWKLGKLEASLLEYSWYAGLDDLRKSVCLDIAFNEGLVGLLHFPKMIAALARHDWQGAAEECAVQDPRLKARYEHLGTLLLAGEGTAAAA